MRPPRIEWATAPRGGLFAPVSSYVGCDSDLLGTIRRGLQWEVIEPPLWRDSKEPVDEKQVERFRSLPEH